MPRHVSIEALERRTHLAGVVDAGWNFSQGEVDKAVGVHLPLHEAIDAGRGRTLLVGYASDTAAAEIMVVALGRDGHPDRTFAGDGVVDSGLTLGDGAYKVAVSGDGYAYVANGTDLVRLRGNGTRDRAFGGGRAVDWTRGEATSRVLALAPDGEGGVAVLRSVQRPTGRTFKNLYGVDEPVLDGVVQVVHVSIHGVARTAWETSFRDGVADELYSELQSAHVTPLDGGGYVVLAARQLEADDIDSPFGDKVRGDVLTYFIDAEGKLTSADVFNTGTDAQPLDVRVEGNGRRVRFAYDNGRRVVRLTDGSVVRRLTLAVGLGTPGLPDGQTFALNGQSVQYGERPADGDKLRFSLLNSDGSSDRRFGKKGTYELPTTGRYPGPFEIVSAQPGSVLIGWSTFDTNRRVSNRYLLRLWTGAQPAATLATTVVRGGTATLTVTYRAPVGIAVRTVNSRDAVLTSKRGHTGIRLIDRRVDGDTVFATYRAIGLLRGSYVVDLLPAQVGTGDDEMNAEQRLGSISVA